MRKINKIILHCSATQEDKNFTVEDIDKWHKKNGWDCCGYHYVIHLDGSVHLGRPIEKSGAHCFGQNQDSIGICYIGGLDKNNKAKDTRTRDQKIGLLKLVKTLLNKYGLSINNVYCHRDFAKKECPCFSRYSFIKEFNEYFNKN